MSLDSAQHTRGPVTGAPPVVAPAAADEPAIMVSSAAPRLDRREQLLAMLREFAARRGRTDSMTEFLRETQVHEAELKEHFLSWGEYEVAAGVLRIAPEHRDDHTLFLDLHRVALDLERFPAPGDYHWRRRFGFNTIRRRFGPSWPAVERRYASWLSTHHPLHPLRASLPTPAGPTEGLGSTPGPRRPRPARRDAREPLVVGRPWYHPAMPFEPLNELGVIILFGHAADTLGFKVESISALRFPDCTAYRAVNPARTHWRRISIEFEFQSRTFRDHMGDVRRCDLVVCWEHTWVECPVPVLELKSALPPLLAKLA